MYMKNITWIQIKFRDACLEKNQETLLLLTMLYMEVELKIHAQQ